MYVCVGETLIQLALFIIEIFIFKFLLKTVKY